MAKEGKIRQKLIEMDVLDITYSRWLEILRYANRLKTLDNHRLPKIVRNWEISKGGKGWWSDLVSKHYTCPTQALAFYMIWTLHERALKA